MSSAAPAARVESPAPPVGSRVLQLDILRGLAILLVLGIHSPSARGESGLLRPLDALSHQFGWTGVDLFFVLSGFLIGGLLFSEIKKYGRLDIGRFLTRRMMRIWPAYYALLIFAVARITYESGSFAKAWSSMWPAFFHIQNFIECPRDQLWSLAVEEHFYIALPVFLWFVTRTGKPRDAIPAVPIACAVLSVSCILLRIVLVFTTDIDVRLHTDLSFDALFFGVNLAYLRAYRPELLQAIVKRRRLIMAFAWLLFIPAVVNSGALRRTIGYTGVYLAYALYLVCFVLGEPGKLAKRWLSSSP
ncbi:MAG TPA: acyltransferase, partial [Polyangiaceae bacterium]|nr:acyltransferase [Polyangiaceae bacterium]